MPHDAAVSRIATAVKAFYSRQEPYRIFHGSTNSTRPYQKQSVVDISALSNVVSIDTTAKTATVEPNVPMDKLVEATLQHGLIPPVVMEFPGITVGGGYAGSAGESSSFKYGYFDQTVNSVEVVLANGDVVTASKTERPELFKGAAGALGTLGITTLIELQLIQAKKYVKIEYHRRGSVHDSIEKLQQEIKDPSNDYVDGIIFSKNHGVIITGQLTDEIPELAQPQTFSKSWDPWFYLHVKDKTIVEATSPVTDYIPLAEYLFRYDRGGFWVGIEAFRYFPFVPFNKFTRWFLDDFIHTRMLYRAMHGSRKEFGNIVQDLSLPYSTAEKFIDYTADELDIWPLWLCPLREMTPPTFHPYTTLPGPDETSKPMLNIGLWGRASDDLDTFVAQNRRLESKLTELGGRKVLYSHTYYTEAEFWSLYDKKWYDELRERYSASSLLTVYDKVKVDVAKHKQTRLSWTQRLASMWPFAGMIGIWGAIRSKDYLLHRHAAWRYRGTIEKKDTHLVGDSQL
ncbi:FAD-binding domain-containing protein [Mollisia scopiformis]|uniref:Delta(24)-sterol reductase n=1 Tax=Mollisia scopiformis TaxID=149040 RepID=A0A132B7Q7_MOLSC|nr:FAD-binding domain-containing protein [Mollisia scopiformis]KUJ07717.1 FAD-binding domain-containing protein [Mollisia scopiformis]